ncbi:tyrosine--tRNA ligase [Elizabethkingia meningoseptica]|uniref:tyrosine--tRNA ligase n=1 Tax=Elizabethkingia meningoseptica TaxID=238 RepID=UPI000332BFFF|nr:tyrosine--tRNA ligase [Elizabethkingia meningoseptica]AQX06450.1 tyrosine--tRNA ligase [Elizabethkingia meningoseptica]AQX48497.1 tyrosine--tRNA ligase [Elizabethkingia meningoseptica]EOR28441.1 tyrosyl-tRNA ligase [Elizabethkingia meningoseptica ATCC 13253 = NBRC 12535]KUY16584.1 tyrosine--tRNA ligase [Elizabethkingia meningoseptica]MDE5488002.1 tyrosine--tRNA ligase [Elizabethkingia meningoseptica]
MNAFIEELKWRGLWADMTPGTEDQLNKEMTTAYIGFDPTADSLHIGSLIPIKILAHFQRHGHKPVALVGGATGMIGDPSGKSAERNLLDEETLLYYVDCLKKQLSRFLDFEGDGPNKAELVNNYDWMKSITFLDFAKDIGKHITVNYMMAKDSVKKRFSGEDGADGMSFTEFTYQLLQGYDYLHLYKEKGIKLQMGGSDQWGNITTGTELIRRKAQGEAYALTTKLITKADGSKFGKSESGENYWLDAKRTSPYKFYQFWLNATDEDGERFIKFYTFLEQDEIEKLIEEHKTVPHERKLQKKLAEEVTVWVHGREEYEKALKASEILFGRSTAEDLVSLDEELFLQIFEGVPQKDISKSEVVGSNIVDLISDKSGFLKSKGEAKRELTGNAISVNKEKVSDTFEVSEKDLIDGTFLLLQKGKKNYFIVKAV